MTIWAGRDKWFVLLFILALAGFIGVTEYVDYQKNYYTRLRRNIDDVSVKIVILQDQPTEDGLIRTVIRGHGSGTIVARDGFLYFVLTSRHLRVDKDVYFLVEHENMLIPRKAFIVDVSPTIDLMMIGFVAEDVNLSVAKIRMSEPEVREPIYAYGHGCPVFAYTQDGIITKKRSMWPIDHPEAWMMNAPIWYGMSGGGIFDYSGRLIGVNMCIRISGYTEHNECSGMVGYPFMMDFLRGVGFALSRHAAEMNAGTAIGAPDEGDARLLPQLYGQ